MTMHRCLVHGHASLDYCDVPVAGFCVSVLPAVPDVPLSEEVPAPVAPEEPEVPVSPDMPPPDVPEVPVPPVPDVPGLPLPVPIEPVPEVPVSTVPDAPEDPVPEDPEVPDGSDVVPVELFAPPLAPEEPPYVPEVPEAPEVSVSARRSHPANITPRTAMARTIFEVLSKAFIIFSFQNNQPDRHIDYPIIDKVLDFLDT